MLRQRDLQPLGPDDWSDPQAWTTDKGLQPVVHQHQRWQELASGHALALVISYSSDNLTYNVC